MGRINSQYPNLFDTGGADDPGRENEDEDSGPDSGGSGFADKWGWISHVDGVSETMRVSWDDVFRMPAIEFLNVVCYRKDKADEERRRIEQWKKRN